MGQVIDFQQRRPLPVRQDQPRTAPVPVALSPVTLSYAQAMLEPSWALWRSLVASYAGLWFAPFGIEVRVAENPPRRPAQAKVNTSGR